MKIIPNRAILVCTGRDAESFLQGILTNDVRQKGLQYALILTPQGKLLHDLFIHKAEDGSFVLDCYANAVDDIKDLLNKFKLGSKVNIETDDAMIVYSSLTDGYDDPRHIQFGKRIYSHAKHECDLHDDSESHYALSFPRLYVDFESGKYFPFDLGFDHFNAISYNKGCYIGQEVITRTHFRGVVRKKVHQVKLINSSINPVSGPLNLDLFASEQKVGTLLGLYSPDKGLALLKSDTPDIKLQSSDGVVSVNRVVHLLP